MKKIFIVFAFFILCLNMHVSAETGNIDVTGTIVKNKLFAITLPDKLKGTYEIKQKKIKYRYFIKILKRQVLADLLLA